MLRRVAITLVGITAAGFMAAGPAAAATMDDGRPFKSNRYDAEKAHGEFGLLNIGGRKGITKVKGSFFSHEKHHGEHEYKGHKGHKGYKGYSHHEEGEHGEFGFVNLGGRNGITKLHAEHDSGEKHHEGHHAKGHHDKD
ncbi:hypothetical protein [Streptomyces flavidovirens]|uniref:hypothetical protein n=1 Tax=Streptomyces flavidovirens TaxID=67298 RepID=UPI003697A85D